MRRPTHRRQAPGWVALLIPLALSCSQSGPKREPTVTQPPGPDLVRQCIGRFCLDVPASISRAGEVYDVRGVALQEVAWAPGAKEPAQQAWAAKLAEIEALKAERESPSDAKGTIFEERQVKPNLRAVFFCRKGVAKYGTWSALLDAGASGAWLNMDSDMPRKEEALERVAEVAMAYRPTPPEQARPVPGKDWFYLGRGYVGLPFKTWESGEARFVGHPLKVELSVTIKTSFQADKRGLMERFVAAIEKMGTSLSGAGIPVRNRKRRLAGVDGEEMIMRSSEGSRTNLFFLWNAPGKEGTASEPKIVIEMQTSADHPEEKTALWDGLLETLRPVL